MFSTASLKNVKKTIFYLNLWGLTMEPEMNSENWSQPYENQNQPGTEPQPEKPSFFQQDRLQKTWLNVKLSTLIKCLIVIGALLVAAAVIAPKLTAARALQQETSEYYSEFKEDWNDEYYDWSDYDYYYQD